MPKKSPGSRRRARAAARNGAKYSSALYGHSANKPKAVAASNGYMASVVADMMRSAGIASIRSSILGTQQELAASIRSSATANLLRTQQEAAASIRSSILGTQQELAASIRSNLLGTQQELAILPQRI